MTPPGPVAVGDTRREYRGCTGVGVCLYLKCAKCAALEAVGPFDEAALQCAV